MYLHNIKMMKYLSVHISSTQDKQWGICVTLVTYTSQPKLVMNILTNPEENSEEAQKSYNNL